MGGKNRAKLRLLRQRRGLLICDVATLLGHKNQSRVERLEKGTHRLSAEEAFEIAHILDIDVDAVRIKKSTEIELDVKRRALGLAKKLAKSAYKARVKKRLLWLTHLITRKNTKI